MAKLSEDERYEKTKQEMFGVSVYLKKLFDKALNEQDIKIKNKLVSKIQKSQAKCYKYIQKQKLNDNKGGTRQCYPGGRVDTYRPHTHHQNVVDMIDYFFVNDFNSPNDFLRRACPKFHYHESGYSTDIDSYFIDTQPKLFYSASCWEKFVYEGKDALKYLDVNKFYSSEELFEINQKYSDGVITDAYEYSVENEND